MKFHVVAMPHTQSTREYSNCAFNTLTRGFCRMMTSLGHEVVLYSGEDNDAPCAEHVTCITKQEQDERLNVRGPGDILKPPLDTIFYDPHRDWWRRWNASVNAELTKRLKPQEFVCLIGGGVLFPEVIEVAHAAGAMPVEYAVGYAGVSPRTFAAYGSSNWRHVVYGLGMLGSPQETGWRMRAYDRVIPHYFDPADFEYRAGKSDYLLYLGKIKDDKGVNIAARAARIAGKRLVVAGQGPTPVEYGEVTNRYIGPDERRELLTGARAVFVPSLYVEPFGMIAVEALLSGTPLITTDWGGPAEINIDGVTGFHANTMQDFVDAVRNVGSIDPVACRMRGLEYAEDRVRYQYERWFTDLSGLWSEQGINAAA